jgi:hypothetical protein
MIRKSQSFRAANGEDFPCWEKDSSEFCAQIERHHAPIKIVLKTKNDRFLIDRWIRHHSKIVGLENLIIYDNMSDDHEVLSVYREYARKMSRFPTVRRNGWHKGGQEKCPTMAGVFSCTSMTSRMACPKVEERRFPPRSMAMSQRQMTAIGCVAGREFDSVISSSVLK